MACHNELHDGVADLAGKVFTPSRVRDDPLIYSGRALKRAKATPAGLAEITTRQERRCQRSQSIRATC